MEISKQTPVRVIRRVRAFRDADPQEHGPMPLHQAVKEGWTSESSGTVSVRVLIDATGEEITYSPRSGRWRYV